MILDLDGTLLDDEKRIRDCDREAVLKVVESGLKITVFTGRSYQSAKPYVEEMGIDLPVVFQNGALIYDFSNKNVIRMVLLEGEVARNIVLRSKKEEIFPVVFRSFFSKKDMMVEGIYRGSYESYFSHNEWRIVRVSNLLSFIPDFVTEVALVGREGAIERIVSKLENASIVKSTSRDGEVFYEILGPGCSKAEALSFLEDHFKVEPDEVMFIGDGYNDLEIMESVGIPVAMGNAPEEVKRMAKWVTSTNEECGVARAIERFIFE